MLREDQIAAFRRDGFVFVPGFFDRVPTDEIDRWIDELAAFPEQPGKHWVYHENSLTEPGRKLVQRIEKFVEVHPGLNALCKDGRMHRAVSELLGEEAVLFKEKINFKLPGGEGFKAHQDSQAGWGVYADYFVTALVTIDESTRENGCLEIEAGWHQKGLVGEEWKPLCEEATARMEFVPYPASQATRCSSTRSRRTAPARTRARSSAACYTLRTTAPPRGPPRALLCRQAQEPSTGHRAGTGESVRVQGVRIAPRRA